MEPGEPALQPHSVATAFNGSPVSETKVTELQKTLPREEGEGKEMGGGATDHRKINDPVCCLLECDGRLKHEQPPLVWDKVVLPAPREVTVPKP